MIAGSGKMLTPPAVARMYGVSVDKIHQWIRRGELAAMNLAERPGGRPRYHISQADLERFEAGRRVIPPAAAARRPRREQPDLVEYV